MFSLTGHPHYCGPNRYGNVPEMAHAVFMVQPERCIKCRGSSAETDVVWQSLPVFAFGDVQPDKIKVATVAINPSLNEWFDGRWKPVVQRLPLIMDFHADGRDELSDDAVEIARSRRAAYFTDPDRTWNQWFEPLEALMGRVDWTWSYASGTAVHIDMVACPTWSRFGWLPSEAKKALLENCFPHFMSTLAKLPPSTVLLFDGDWVLKTLQQFGGIVTDDGVEELLREPKILGKKGILHLQGLELSFRSWDIPIRKLHPRQRLDVAIWLRGSLGF